MSRWVPPPMDIAVAVVALLVTQAELWTIDVEGSRTALSIGHAVGCVAVAFRRTAPITATAVSLGGLLVIPSAAGVDPAATLSWLVVALLVTGSCGYYAARPMLGLGVILAVMALSIVVQKGFVVEDVLYAWILGGGAWVAGRALATQSRATRLAREHAELTEDRARMQAAAAVTEERLRIAREMHDVVAHSISVMTLHVGGVRRLLRKDQSAEREALASAEHAGRQAMQEMHRVLAVMRESPDATTGPMPSLARLEELLTPVRAAGIEVEVELSGEITGLPSGVDVVAYRIVQEALTNVLRHARASRVAVSLGRDAGALRITVRDDGTAGPAGNGVAGRSGDGHGLLGMQERARAYGGVVRTGRDPAGGFVVNVLLPCGEDEVAALEGAP